MTPVVRELRRRHPDAEVRTQHVAWHDLGAALLEHRVDALVAAFRRYARAQLTGPGPYDVRS